MGGGGSNTSSTIQKADPWVGVQPALGQGISEAQRLYGQGAPQYFPGQTYAPMSPWTQQALQNQAAMAQAGGPGVSAANQNLQDTLTGKYLGSNPYLQGAVNSALGDVQSRVNAQFAGQNYGSSAHEEWLGRQLADRALPIYAQDYANERNRQLAAASMAPSLEQAQYIAPAQLAQAGTAMQNFDQQAINEQIARYNYNTQAPWNMLDQYTRLITGQNLGGSTSGTSTSPYYTNPLATGLGLGMGGLSMYNAANAAGLFGAGAGATAAGAGGLTAAEIAAMEAAFYGGSAAAAGGGAAAMAPALMAVA